MAIAKTASRNVAFKVARVRESIMENQDEFITFIIRDSGREEVSSEANSNNRAAALEDLGYILIAHCYTAAYAMGAYTYMGLGGCGGGG